MKELFYGVLRVSLSGSIVICAVLIARLVLKRAPKTVFCLLWLLAGLRLVLPFQIESSLSLQPRLETVAVAEAGEREAQEMPEENPGRQPPQQNVAEPLLTEQISQPAAQEIPAAGEKLHAASAQKMEAWVVLAGFWLAGVAVMLAASVISYFRLKHKLREAWRTEDGAWAYPGLDTAFVLGLMKPRIYLPAGLKDPERGLILNHERTHIFRGDHISKLVGYWVLAVHWFNPLVWLGYACLCRDIEMACDEQVVKDMDVAARKDYAAALLNCGGHTARIAACPVAFGESDPKARIRNVLNYRKPGFWVLLAAVIVLVFVAVCLMTSPGGCLLGDFAGAAPGSVVWGDLSGGNWEISLNEARIEELDEILQSVRISEEGAGERGKIGEYQLQIFHENLSVLQFSADCSEVWVMGGVKREVLNPAVLRRWIRETEKMATDAVVDREVSGESFAAMDAPAEWLRGVSAGMIREASAYERIVLEQAGGYGSYSQRNGLITEETLTELIRILNQMPEDAVIKQKRISSLHFGYLQTQMSARSGMSLTLCDDVNGLVVMLRILDGEDMELIMTDDLEGVAKDEYLDNYLCWEIGNQELLEFLQAFQADPTLIRVNMSSQIRPERNEEWGLTFSVENVTPGGLTLVCEQDGTLVEGELMTGGFFYLQRLTEEGAQVVPTLQEAAFTAEGWAIDSGETYRWDTNWQWLYGKLEPGVYWLYKFVQRQYGSASESWTAAVEFTITEEMVQGEKETEDDLVNTVLVAVDERLARCWEVLTDFQKRDSYHVTQTDWFVGGNVLNHSATRDYWKSGDDWLYTVTLKDVDNGRMICRLKKDGIEYQQELYETLTDKPQGWPWSVAEDTSDCMAGNWMEQFRWANSTVQYSGAEITDGQEKSVTMTVLEDPSTFGKYCPYTVKFCFDGSGSLLRIGLTLDENQGTSEWLRTNATYYFHHTEDTHAHIDDCYRQACQHIDEVRNCTDPNCTDPTHDHYGISCTVEHCTDPNHGHGHHN